MPCKRLSSLGHKFFYFNMINQLVIELNKNLFDSHFWESIFQKWENFKDRSGKLYIYNKAKHLLPMVLIPDHF